MKADVSVDKRINIFFFQILKLKQFCSNIIKTLFKIK